MDNPSRWPDLTKYKLLIIQTARQYPGQAWLEYDLAFRRDAAATGLSDWSRMNSDLYNFHLRSPGPIFNQQPSSTSSSTPTSVDGGYSSMRPYCISWNNGQCLCPFGACRYRRVCNSCDGHHPKVRCQFLHPGASRSHSPSPSPAKGGRH